MPTIARPVNATRATVGLSICSHRAADGNHPRQRSTRRALSKIKRAHSSDTRRMSTLRSPSGICDRPATVTLSTQTRSTVGRFRRSPASASEFRMAGHPSRLIARRPPDKPASSRHHQAKDAHRSSQVSSERAKVDRSAETAPRRPGCRGNCVDDNSVTLSTRHDSGTLNTGS
jgi:hypothetical protein